jgi:membrane protein DedA with SNARE-associated domain
VLHQTVIIWVGYAINQTGLPLPAKYGVVLIGSFLGILLLYAGMIHRTPFLRYLFGMKVMPSHKHWRYRLWLDQV